MVAGTIAQTVPDGQGGQDGNFRRSRGKEPKEDNSLPSQRQRSRCSEELGIEELEGARGGSSREECGINRKEWTHEPVTYLAPPDPQIQTPGSSWVKCSAVFQRKL